ncbi:hypothetical protein GCM10009721_35520 [Terrabacter tumescens]|uniref:Uncharacterized protein n=1 Tax=Terrabacter tumescens TaxID=60443 RepID=A0ABQ2IBB7_9MICO|nr:hypothetical protein [Terrabacter tumescens]GGN04948.1 hypothetical protein GCM10009721_35520 [Terrabacter tumescens]
MQSLVTETIAQYERSPHPHSPDSSGASAPAGADEGADRVTVRLDKRTHLTVGDVVHVEPNRDEVHLFDAASGERIEA